MKTTHYFVFILTFLLCAPLVQGQKDDFDPNKLKAAYFKDKSVKDKLEFNDKKGNRFKVKNSEYSKGLYIKKDGKWLKHGVFYGLSSGRVTSKTIYFYGKRHGLHESYHSNGKTQFQYNYHNGIKEGKWYQYTSKGSLFEEKTYKNGVIEGTKTTYHSNGVQQFISTYVNGKRHGEVQQFNDKGRLVARSQYNMGQKVGKTQWLH